VPTPVLQSEDLTIRFGGHAAVDRVTCASSRHATGYRRTQWSGQDDLLQPPFRPAAGDGRKGTARGRGHHPPGGIDTRAPWPRPRVQLTNLFPNLSVQENVRLAVQATAGRGHDLWSIWSSNRSLVEEADRILSEVALEHRRKMLAAELPHGDQRKLEVAILLALRPKVFMFDEPTAGMSADEAPVILALIARIKQQRNKTVILVEHKLDVVRSLADRIIVLHQGQLVADGEPADVMASQVVREAYLGERVHEQRWKQSPRQHVGGPVGTLENRAPALLSLAGVQTLIGPYHILHGVDLEVPERGMTMLLGRNGAGKTTTLRTIMGLWKAVSGTDRLQR
jgi:branched-chain amino acid transport system ATP-binding protein